jgi:hypothetical protein
MMKKILYSVLTLILGLVLSSSGCTHHDAPEGPTISNLTAVNITSNYAEFPFDIDVYAMVYMLNQLSTASIPTAATVKSSATMSAPHDAGSRFCSLGGLNPATSYTLYMVAEDANGFGKVVSVTFTTLP